MQSDIKGSAALVIKSLDELPANVHTALSTGLDRGLLYAVGVAQRQFLMGPRPAKLDIRSRRLLNSIEREVSTSGSSISGTLGSNLSYAAYHEFGFHGIVNVKAHSRVVATLDVSGAPIDERRIGKNRRGDQWFRDTRAQAANRTGSNAAFVFTQSVRAHQRRVNYAGRPYLRPALQQSLPQITAEINKELKAITNQ